MIITAFTLPLINAVAGMIQNEQMAWIIVTTVYAVISIIVLLNTYASCTERVQAAQKEKEKGECCIFDGIKGDGGRTDSTGNRCN